MYFVCTEILKQLHVKPNKTLEFFFLRQNVIPTIYVYHLLLCVCVCVYQCKNKKKTKAKKNSTRFTDFCPDRCLVTDHFYLYVMLITLCQHISFFVCCCCWCWCWCCRGRCRCIFFVDNVWFVFYWLCCSWSIPMWERKRFHHSHRSHLLYDAVSIFLSFCIYLAGTQNESLSFTLSLCLQCVLKNKCHCGGFQWIHRHTFKLLAPNETKINSFVSNSKYCRFSHTPIHTQIDYTHTHTHIHIPPLQLQLGKKPKSVILFFLFIRIQLHLNWCGVCMQSMKWMQCVN